MWEEHKVVIVPTNDINADICLYLSSAKLAYKSMILAHHTNQHLYIISDEDIKVGDWIYLKSIGKNGAIGKYSYDEDNNTHDLTTLDNIHYPFSTDKYFTKVIITTNKSLGLPQSHPYFIEEFVKEYNKGNIIEKVLVEYISVFEEKELEDNQTFLDKNWELRVNSENNEVMVKKIKDSWTRDEVEESLHQYREFAWRNGSTKLDLNKWIKENL